jgi:hypothetical protein
MASVASGAIERGAEGVEVVIASGLIGQGAAGKVHYNRVIGDSAFA